MSGRCEHAILLVGHGTRQASGTAEFFQFSELLAKTLPAGCLVRPCLLEFQSPTIAEAWRSLIEVQPRRVTVAPLLLFAAGHAKSDIPDEISRAAQQFPLHESPPIDFCPPISRQAALIAAVRERLTETLEQVPNADGRGPIDSGGRASRDVDALQSLDDVAPPSHRNRTDGVTAVVMVGRGSRDACATSDMRVLSEVALFGRSKNDPSLARQFEIDRDAVQTTFYAMAEPRLTQTLQQVAGSGRIDRVVVYPHLLFSGRLNDAIRRQVAEAAEQFPEIAFQVGDYLGPTKRVAEAVAARILGDRRRF